MALGTKLMARVLLLAAAILLIWLGYFSWKNLRGIIPALKSPPQKIGEIINTTGMPFALPPGFSIKIFAGDLGKPRVQALDHEGNLLVSIPSQGRVVALPDKNRDGAADEIRTVAENLNHPHGLAFQCREKCRLYIAETDQVAVFDYDVEKMTVTNKRKIVDLPSGGNHMTRTLLFMPPQPNQNFLLVSVGSSCNVCREQDWRRAAIIKIDLEDESVFHRKENPGAFAIGLRNSVFMAVHPNTQKIWATEMGRDLLGDNLPPDEINIIEEPKHYGWPYCYGKNIHDAEFDSEKTHVDLCTNPSHIDIPAHSAPLGLAFVPENWPKDWKNDLLVAYHGSWNRSVPTGYKIVRFPLDEKGNVEGEPEDFITGWLTKDGALGRPVDILMTPDGTMFVSDDKAGVIYRVSTDGEG